LARAARLFAVWEPTLVKRNVQRWADMIGDPVGVKRGHMVNRFPASQWHQRHDASHFDMTTQNELVPELSKVLLLRQNNPSGGARFRGCRRATLIERLGLLSRFCVKR